jgi:hypothetical protein
LKVVLKKYGDQLDRSGEKQSITKSGRGKEFLHTIKRRKANWICHFLRRNCLPKRVIKGKIEGTGRRGRSYLDLKEEALDRTLWRTRFGKAMDLSNDRLRDDDLTSYLDRLPFITFGLVFGYSKRFGHYLQILFQYATSVRVPDNLFTMMISK